MENPIQKEARNKRNKEITELYPQLTLMEIGKRYNLKPQRIHQIIKKSAEPAVSGKVKIIKK
jgi:hypothetical protein